MAGAHLQSMGRGLGPAAWLRPGPEALTISPTAVVHLQVRVCRVFAHAMNDEPEDTLTGEAGMRASLRLPNGGGAGFEPRS